MIRTVALFGVCLVNAQQDGSCECQNGSCQRNQITDDKSPVRINECWNLCRGQNAQACQWQQFRYCKEFDFFGIKTFGDCNDHDFGRCFRYDRNVSGGDGRDSNKNKCLIIQNLHRDYSHIRSCSRCIRQDRGTWQSGQCTYNCELMDVSCWINECPEQKASWGPWSSYDSCNCNTGKKTRTRVCNQNGRCKGTASQHISCNNECNNYDVIFVQNQKNQRKQCQFPFYYKNQYHTTCIEDDELEGSYWCSTKTDSNNHHVSGQKEWGYCEDDNGNNEYCPYNQSTRRAQRDHYICENGQFCKKRRCCRDNNSKIAQCPEKKMIMCQEEQRGDKRCVKEEWKCDRFGGLMPAHRCPRLDNPRLDHTYPNTPEPQGPKPTIQRCHRRCSKSMLGNGRCDKKCNNAACNFDDGDCQHTGKQKCPLLCLVFKKNDGRCDNECNIPECNFDGNDCKNNTCPRKCRYKGGNSLCDQDCNLEACDYDNGDCQRRTCPVWCHYSQSNGTCDQACNIQECAYDGTDCHDAPYITTPPPSVNDCARGCTEDIIGDNVCDPQCNVLSCNFDNGDCQNPINTSTTTPSPPSNLCSNGTSYTLSVEEQCQQCSCDARNGQVHCRGGQRIRKEVHDLTTEEFNRFAEGIVRIQRKGDWERYVDLHTVPGWTAAHGPRSHFFHWHRQFLYQLETAIIAEMNDCNISIPYWNWALDPNPSTSRVWQPDYYGSNNLNTNSVECVQTGPFSQFQQNSAQDWWIGRNDNEDYRGCLRRQWTEIQFPSIARLEILKNDEFQRFQDELEIDHGVVHCAIGGHMCIGGLSTVNRNILSGISTYDPMFFSHHAMVDYLFAQRQEGRSEESNTDRVGHNTLLGFRHPSTDDTMSLDHVQNTNLLKVDSEHELPWGVVYQESDVLQRIVNGETDAMPVRVGIRNNNGGIADSPPIRFDRVQPEAAKSVCTLKEALCMITYLNKNYPNYEQEVTPCCPPDDIIGRIKMLEMILVGKTAEVAAILEEIEKNSNQSNQKSILRSYQDAQAAENAIKKQIQDLQREYKRKTAFYTRRQSTSPKSRVDKAICMSAKDLLEVYVNQQSDITACLTDKTRAALNTSSRTRSRRFRPEDAPDIDLDMYTDGSAVFEENVMQENSVNDDDHII